MRYALILLLLPVVAGCAASRQCERSERVYGDAVEQAPLQAPEGLEVPPPDPNFAIPEATGERVDYAVTVTDRKGRARSRCLDSPPPMPTAALSPPELEPEPEQEPEIEPEGETEPAFDTEPLPEPVDDTEPEPSEF